MSASGLPSLAPRPPGMKRSPVPPKPMSREHSEAEWLEKKELLRQLYVVEDRKLVDIMALMAHRYGFAASEQMYKKRFKRWNFRKRQYRRSTASTPPTTPSAHSSEDGKEVVQQPRSASEMAMTICRQSSPVHFVPQEEVLRSVFSWSQGQLDSSQVLLDPMSRYLAGPGQPLIDDSRTMYRTFELVYELWRLGRGDLAGMAARRAFFSLEYVLTNDHPDLVWHILDTLYDMIEQGHLQLLVLFLRHANELARRQLPKQHPLVRIFRQLQQRDYQIKEVRDGVQHLLRQAWMRNVDLLGAQIGSAVPQHFWLYEQLIWDGRTKLRRNSGLDQKRDTMIKALGELTTTQSTEAEADAKTPTDQARLRIEALELEFTQMDLGNKVEAEQLAKRLLEHTDSGSSRPCDDRFQAYARKMLSRICEDRQDWVGAEENLKLAVSKREAAHGTGNNLRVIRDMWVLAGFYQRAGRPQDAQFVRQDALARAQQFLSEPPVAGGSAPTT
ncbi:Clr5 domain-containing protein [Stachybotrys elegans]|uniref:Clr5 domain-containing protein n=1 Tax=Stachybotrys elegans TaxID=80388 RepID=A0A8K0WT40_9HYPO|nr:Clr5 domain-containing protein [Stachybotrys elegans]